MMRRLSRLHREESGIAMVVAMMVVFVVVLLSIVILDLSIHNVDQAAYDRKRVTSVAASEAGIDQAWNLVQYTRPENLPCASPDTGTLGSAPGPAAVLGQLHLVRLDGLRPHAVRSSQTQRSVGGPGDLDGDHEPRGAADDAGVHDAPADVRRASTRRSSPCRTRPSTTTSPSRAAQGNNGDIYITNGNLTVTNTPNIYGNVYVHNGCRHDDQQQQDHREPVGERIDLDQQPGERDGQGDLLDLEHLGERGRSAGTRPPATTIAAGLAVGGTRYANSPQGPPPTQVFPLLCQVAIAGVCNALPWTGYTLHTFTGASACTSARTFLRDRHADRRSRGVDQPGLQPRDREQRRRSTSPATSRS